MSAVIPVRFITIEDEFNRLFNLISKRESMRNSRLMKQLIRIRQRLLAIKEERKRRKLAGEVEIMA